LYQVANFTLAGLIRQTEEKKAALENVPSDFVAVDLRVVLKEICKSKLKPPP
jgi:hypothetical protein